MTGEWRTIETGKSDDGTRYEVQIKDETGERRKIGYRADGIFMLDEKTNEILLDPREHKYRLTDTRADPNYGGLYFCEAKELIGDAFTGEDQWARYLLNMWVGRQGKEWVHKHRASYVERGKYTTFVWSD